MVTRASLGDARAEARDIRKADILALLSKEPMSVKELSEALDLNYYTVRLDVQDFRRDGKVHVAGSGGTNVKFKAGPQERIPRVYVAQAKRTMSLPEIVEGWVRADFADTGTVRAGRLLNKHMLELLHYAHLVHTKQPVERTDLPNLQKNLTAVHDVLESALGITKQLLGNTTLWDDETLKTMALDPDFPEWIVKASIAVTQIENGQEPVPVFEE